MVMTLLSLMYRILVLSQTKSSAMLHWQHTPKLSRKLGNNYLKAKDKLNG